MSKQAYRLDTLIAAKTFALKRLDSDFFCAGVRHAHVHTRTMQMRVRR